MTKHSFVYTSLQPSFRLIQRLPNGSKHIPTTSQMVGHIGECLARILLNPGFVQTPDTEHHDFENNNGTKVEVKCGLKRIQNSGQNRWVFGPKQLESERLNEKDIDKYILILFLYTMRHGASPSEVFRGYNGRHRLLQHMELMWTLALPYKAFISRHATEPFRVARKADNTRERVLVGQERVVTLVNELLGSASYAPTCNFVPESDWTFSLADTSIRQRVLTILPGNASDVFTTNPQPSKPEISITKR